MNTKELFKAIKEEVLNLSEKEKNRIKDKYENMDDSCFDLPEGFEFVFPEEVGAEIYIDFNEEDLPKEKSEYSIKGNEGISRRMLSGLMVAA